MVSSSIKEKKFIDSVEDLTIFVEKKENNLLSNIIIKEKIKYDVYVYLVKHQSFKKLNIIYKKNSLILDLNHVLDNKKKLKIKKNKNFKSFFIGS